MFGAAFLLALALPFTDFRGVLWLVLLGAFPIVIVVVLLIAAAAILAFVRAMVRFSEGAPKLALRYLAVATLVPAALFTGNWLNEVATVLSCSGDLDKAIKEVQKGRKLPPRTQAFSIQVFQTNPDVASEGLEGPLFAAQYIAYDAADNTTPAVETRLGHALDDGRCAVDAHRVIGNYYWVSEGC